MNQASHSPTITIIGAGFVGLTTAAIFARAGHKTYLVDVDEARIEQAKQGKAFFFEHGLDPLIAFGVEHDLLIPTTLHEEAVSQSDIVISAVGTPDNPDGSSNLNYIFEAAEQSAPHLKPRAVYVQKSTVPPGTGAKLKQLFKQKDTEVQYVSNPEFLRESTAVYDSLWFDRIVVGGSNPEALERVLAIYRSVQRHRDDIAATANLSGPDTIPAERYITTTLENAELIKVTSNAFLALKISFANSIAKLADQTGANITEVMDVVGADSRIGRAFLNAGRGFGGGCFPKDVSGLIRAASEHGVDMPIMSAALEVNDSMPGYIINKAKDRLGDIKGKRIAVLGLAFKAGTSDVRRSPGVALANILSHNGAIVTAYDPRANHEAKSDLRNNIYMHEDIESTIKDADAVLIATDWIEFTTYDPAELAKNMRGKLLVDCMNAISRRKIENAGLTYIGVGR